MGKSMKLGGGGKFEKLESKLQKKGESAKEAKAVAAEAGMKKYGKAKMEKMAQAGKKKK